MNHSPTDVRINLYLETEEGQLHAPDGPGWYVDVRYGGGEIEVAPRTRVTVKNVEEVASALDSVLQKKKLNYSSDRPKNTQSILSVVKAASQVAKQSVVEALRRAQAAAAQAAELEKRVEEFEDG